MPLCEPESPPQLVEENNLFPPIDRQIGRVILAIGQTLYMLKNRRFCWRECGIFVEIGLFEMGAAMG